MILTDSLTLAIDLASRGDFSSAIEVLKDRWPGVGVEPAREDAGDLDYARLLLVCGMLTLELAHTSTTPEASAKDLLSRSIRLFGDDPGESEARLWLGVAYLRCGENNEALMLADALLSEQKAASDVVFAASGVKGLALLNLGDVAASEQAFESVAMLLPAVPSLTQGRFFLSRGMLHRKIGRLDAAIADHECAAAAFRNAGSARYEAAARNNVAVVYTEQGRYAEARETAEAALNVFIQIGDRACEAKAWDQLARIYERESNFVEMERCAAAAVRLLSDSDRESWLAEALITHGTALANLGLEQATRSITNALEIARRLLGDKPDEAAPGATSAAWKLVQEAKSVFGDAMRSYEAKAYEEALARHNGRITPAARELGLSHQTLQNRLESRFPELLKKRRKKWTRNRSVFKPRAGKRGGYFKKSDD